MRIIAVSDTHTRTKDLKIPDGDMIIHCGDATFRGEIPEVQYFCDWMQSLPHKYKLFCPGNHDWLFEHNPNLGESMLKDAGIIYMHEKSITIECIKFYGAAYTPRFHDWAFNVDRGSLIKQYWDLIPDDTDVLITHGPPFGIGDFVFNRYTPGQRVGCEELVEAVKRVKPQVHLFGHIHCDYGEYYLGPTRFLNCSTCDENYQPVNPPWVFELTGPKNSVSSSESETKGEGQ